MLIKGSEMNFKTQQEALNRFVHRYTKDHKPAWASQPMPNGASYPVQHNSDKEWLEHTYFHVTETGELSRRHSFCESFSTWPDNPELRRQKH
jgi:hypothetical protein